MHFKRKKDFTRSNDGTLIMHGEWYDSAEDAEDEDVRPWLIDQIRLPVADAKHATVELIEDAIARRADILAPERAQVLSPEDLDGALPEDVKAVFGRNRVVDVVEIVARARSRREAVVTGPRQ